MWSDYTTKWPLLLNEALLTLKLDCSEGESVDLEKEFEPNTLNSVVYLVDMGMQVSTFAVNYRGEPFMQSIWSHKPLRNSLLITFGVVLLLAANLMPELTEWFQLVPFSDQVRSPFLHLWQSKMWTWLFTASQYNDYDDSDGRLQLLVCGPLSPIPLRPGIPQARVVVLALQLSITPETVNINIR